MSTKATGSAPAAGYTTLAQRLRSHGHVGGEDNAVLLLASGDASVDTASIAAGIADALQELLHGPVALVHRSPGVDGAAERVEAESLLSGSRSERETRIGKLRSGHRAVIIDGGSLHHDTAVMAGPLADKRLLLLDLGRTTEPQLQALGRELALHTLTFDGFLAVGHQEVLPRWLQRMVG